MIDLEKYKRLKNRVEQADLEANKAKGGLEQIKKQLKEFDCNSIEDAESLLKELGDEAAGITHKYTMALKEFEKKWNDKFTECKEED